jgi:hypothetical protein
MRLSRVLSRCVLTSVALLLLMRSIPCWAQKPASTTPAATARSLGGSSAADEAVLNTLQTAFVDAEYNRVDLSNIIDDLRQKHNLNIHVSWAALEAAGVKRDVRIEIHLKHVALSTLLDILLREARVGGTEQLAYHVQDGVLVISTGEQAREDTILRTYDIADLVESGYATRRFANTPVLGLQVTGREYVGGDVRKESSGGGGGGAGIYGEPRAERARTSDMERVQQIVDLLENQVDPESWRDAGGSLGSLQVSDSVLYVRHTMRAQQQVGAFLDLMRSNRPVPLDADALIVRLRVDKALAWRRQVGPIFPRLTNAQIDELLKSSDSGGVLFSGSTSGFNGQGMFFNALTQRDVLTGSNAVVAQGASAYMPLTGAATSGLELIVLPLVTPHTEEMTLDVQMAWVPNTQVITRPVALGPVQSSVAAESSGSGSGPSIDETTRSMRTISSTAKVRLGEAIALSIPAELSPDGKSMEWEDWLIVRVRRPGA